MSCGPAQSRAIKPGSGCTLGTWVEWNLHLEGDGPDPLVQNETLFWNKLWEDCPVPWGTLVDLYVLERRWFQALSVGFEKGPNGPQNDPTPNWPLVAPPTEHADRRLFCAIRVGMPIWFRTRGGPIRQRARGDSTFVADPAPIHGQDVVGGVELGVVVNENRACHLVVLVAPGDLSVAGDTTSEVWVQSPTGLWVLAAPSAASFTRFVSIDPAWPLRRIYPRLTASAQPPGGFIFTEVMPYGAVGHDFTDLGGGRISDPYIRVKIGALVVGEAS